MPGVGNASGGVRIWEVSGGAREGPNDEASGGGLVVSGKVSGTLSGRVSGGRPGNGHI